MVSVVPGAQNSDSSLPDSAEDAVVPIISVRVVHALRLPRGHCAVVEVEVEGVQPGSLKMVEPDSWTCPTPYCRWLRMGEHNFVWLT